MPVAVITLAGAGIYLGTRSSEPEYTIPGSVSSHVSAEKDVARKAWNDIVYAINSPAHAPLVNFSRVVKKWDLQRVRQQYGDAVLERAITEIPWYSPERKSVVDFATLAQDYDFGNLPHVDALMRLADMWTLYGDIRNLSPMANDSIESTGRYPNEPPVDDLLWTKFYWSAADSEHANEQHDEAVEHMRHYIISAFLDGHHQVYDAMPSAERIHLYASRNSHRYNDELLIQAADNSRTVEEYLNQVRRWLQTGTSETRRAVTKIAMFLKIILNNPKRSAAEKQKSIGRLAEYAGCEPLEHATKFVYDMETGEVLGTRLKIAGAPETPCASFNINLNGPMPNFDILMSELYSGRDPYEFSLEESRIAARRAMRTHEARKLETTAIMRQMGKP